MFTGIVTHLGTIADIEITAGDTIFTISNNFNQLPALGESIACDGICLTVMRVVEQRNRFAVQVSAETFNCTTIGQWKAGTRINLERALKMGDPLGGHIVNGHIDGVGRVQEVRPLGSSADDSWYLRIAVPQEFANLLAPKGAVAVNGVSLTVNEVAGNEFSVNLIPYTWHHTTLSSLQKNSAVNIEFDTIARYVARLVEAHLGQVKV